MPDYHGVVWTRLGTGPIKMGDLVATPGECRFSYSEEFLDLGTDAAGLSLLSSPRIFGRNPVVFQTRPGFSLHPRLMELIPREGRGNLQRRLYRLVFEQSGSAPKPGIETDWQLLLFTGRNGIGHLDVFRDDRIAESWYRRRLRKPPGSADRSRLWQTLRDDVTLDVEQMDVALVSRILGPTPSAGGMIPKLAVAIPDATSWNGLFTGPGTPEVDGAPYVDVLLKIEPAEYRGISDLEALCLELHREAGFEVPRFWRASFDGLELLAVERFDRTPAGQPLPMESFYSVFATGDRHFSSNMDTHLGEVSQRLETLASVVNIDVLATQKELYRRLCFAVCTGNGDLHLENVSFLGGPASTRLAPVYDPAPMRAWPRHDLRFAIPLDFDESVGGFGENLIALGTSFGLSPKQAKNLLTEALESTNDYTARVMALTHVPEERRKRLALTVDKERAILSESNPV